MSHRRYRSHMNAGRSFHLPNQGPHGRNWGRHATVLGYIPGLWVTGCILKGNMKRSIEPQCDWVKYSQVGMTEIVWYMATYSYWGQDRPWQLQTLHAEACPLVLVTVDKPCSASDFGNTGIPCNVGFRDSRSLRLERLFGNMLLLPY